MKTSLLSRQPSCTLLLKYTGLLIFSVATVLSFAPEAMAARHGSVSNYVASEDELNAAIVAFNGETRHRRHHITLTADIILTTSTSTIENNHDRTGASLIINGAGFGVQGATGVRVFSIAAQTYVVIKQITVTGGNVYYRGAGILNAGNLKLIDSTVSDNHSEEGGGCGIANEGTMTITRCTVSYNRSFFSGSGGGIYNNGTMTVTDSLILHNSAGMSGGGIFNNRTLTIVDSEISHNFGTFGGGVTNSGTLTVIRSTISDNGSDFDGGGIENDCGVATLNYCTISGNGADNGGGIFNYNTMTILNSTITGNRGHFGSGAGIHNEDTLTVTNSTISGNSADFFGGGISSSGNVTLTNVTVSDNTIIEPDGGGGGVDIWNGMMILENTIIANNSAGDCIVGLNGKGTVNAFSSLIEGTGEDACNLTDGDNGNIIGVDPMLGPLQDNGGPTMTHALLGGSPAIDKGDNGLAIYPDGRRIGTDQRGKGYPRILGPKKAKKVDMGAFEAGRARSILP